MEEKQTYGNREDRAVFETLLKTGRNKEGFVPRAYLSGIGGIGVSAVAHILLDAGWSVCGADIQASRVTQELGERGAKIYLGHSAENLKYDPVDVAVYSSAVRRDSQDILEIQRRRIPLLHRAEALASILRQYCGICVSGMHGKTTVSSLLVCALNGWARSRDMPLEAAAASSILMPGYLKIHRIGLWPRRMRVTEVC